jgi:solute carrier family 35 protein C2
MTTKPFFSRFVVGLGNPVDAMYYIQPWMLAVIIPLACVREGMFFFPYSFLCFVNFPFIFILGQQLLLQLYVLNKKSFAHIGYYTGIFGSSALLAFSLEFSEFLLVSNTSSLTLSVSGIFKVKNFCF